MNEVKTAEQHLPEDLAILLRQLALNGHIGMAGRVLRLYLCRCLKINEEVANHYVTKYFEATFPKQLTRHRKKRKKAMKQLFMI
ncbi:hypothetical protein [Guptibacillus hwajinpoensis]|uniref:hypothetical protein n=1 Tax=Guptibacillus hwajinpoensis TaxID=208199 RepID=UPI0037363427